jgi:hypothetical protein
MKQELETSRGVPQFMNLEPADFDGHTEFASMSAEQRLTWLSHVARFVFVAREAAKSGNNSLVGRGSRTV